MRCVVGTWKAGLDKDDREAFARAVGRKKRVDLYADICVAHGGRPFGLTALKDHLNHRCICN